MKTSNMFLIGTIFVVACFTIYLFQTFLLHIFVGALLSISTSGINIKIRQLTCNKKIISTIITTIIFCAIFFIPFVYAIVETVRHVMEFDYSYVSKITNFIQNYDFKLPSIISAYQDNIKNFFTGININSIVNESTLYISRIGKNGAKFIIDVVLIVVFYFFFNLYGGEIIKYFRNILPLSKTQIDFIFIEIANTMSVVFYSTIVNAILQGTLFGIIAYIYGYEGVLLGLVFAFSSLIPGVGGALVYVPISIYELSTGDTEGAIVILAYSIIMISTIADTFIKPFIIKYISSKLIKNTTNINELLIFFAMIAGIATFGFWGLILGPAILTLFLAVLKLYESINQKYK